MPEVVLATGSPRGPSVTADHRAYSRTLRSTFGSRPLAWGLPRARPCELPEGPLHGNRTFTPRTRYDSAALRLPAEPNSP